jgi:ligand-binding sensor domain-containing protein
MKAHLLKAAAAAIVLFVVHQTAFAQWQQLTLPSQAPVIALAVLHGNIYASSGGILYRSSDDGAHWALDTANGLHGLQVTALQADGDNLVAGTNKTVFISSDDGASWLDLIAGFLADFTVSSLTTNGDVIIAATADGGLAVTTDQGISWTDPGITDSIHALAYEGGDFFAALSHGAVRSLDSGAVWSGINTGLRSLSTGLYYVQSIAAEGNYLFAGATQGHGILYSTDKGTDWTATQSSGMGVDSHGNIRTVNCFWANGSRLFAGTLGGGIYVTADYGANWASLNSGLTDTNIYAMTTTATYLFVGTENGLWEMALSGESVNEAIAALPSSMDLQQNFPNPFSSVSDISFIIKDASLYGKEITLQICDAEGKIVQTTYNGEADGAEHIIHFNGSTLPAGSYFYRLQCGGVEISKAMNITR